METESVAPPVTATSPPTPVHPPSPIGPPPCAPVRQRPSAAAQLRWALARAKECPANTVSRKSAETLQKINKRLVGEAAKVIQILQKKIQKVIFFLVVKSAV